ncbi:hypothetical protein F4861DRAFT_531061 [Xylaria intraflava]|nr:hypothetical protein F4861DRAFT_531061 [Xylaria intraflava]
MAAIYEELRDMFFNPRHSDLAIVCDDGACFKVHRVIISLYSPVLYKMITEDLEEGGQIVAQIRLSDIHSDIVYMVLQFLYGGNYNDYETIGCFHAPSHVVFMTPKAIGMGLASLPCGPSLWADPVGESTSDYEEEDEEEESCNAEDLDDLQSESSLNSQSGDADEDEDRDDERIRTFQGHNLFDSLRVYCAASRFDILALKLLSRDRFYRTAEKVLMYPPGADDKDEEPWLSYDHQRAYRPKLAESIFNDFPRVVDELWQTVPESDTMMRSIPAILIATGYNNNAFRDQMRPVLEKYPDLTLAVLECLRTPEESQE